MSSVPTPMLAPRDQPQPPRVTDELQAELIAVRDRLDSRIRCLARNRDALDSWLDESLRSPGLLVRTQNPLDVR